MRVQIEMNIMKDKNRNVVLVGVAIALLIGGGALLLRGSPLPYNETGTGITVRDQQIEDSRVVVDSVNAPENSWLVIHRDENGQPGEVIGYTDLSEGANSNVRVQVNSQRVTNTLYAMLHKDEGELGEYEFPDGDPPVVIDNRVSVNSFQVLEAEDNSGGGPKTYKIEMRGSEFVPETLRIEKGSTVEWVNKDSYRHTVTGFGVDESIPGQGTFTHTFDQKGTYQYDCTIHPGMDGEIMVS